MGLSWEVSLPATCMLYESIPATSVECVAIYTAIDHEQVLLKSNQSYGQLTASMGQLGAQEPLHEYDYVGTQKL